MFYKTNNLPKYKSTDPRVYIEDIYFLFYINHRVI